MSKKIKNIKNTHLTYAMENPSKPDETEWIENQSFLLSNTEHDLQGNIIKTVTYSEYGGIHEMYEYKYDIKNNLVEELCYFDENELAEHRFIFWDENNVRISEKTIYQEGGENIVILSYDNAGKLIERRVVDQDNDLQEKEIYVYEDKQLVSEKRIDEEEKLMYEKKYKYNTEGLIEQYEYISPEHAAYSKVLYFYSEKGNREKILRYNWKDQLIVKTLFTEDENGNVTEIDEEDQKSKKITRLTYDEQGNAIKQEEFNEDDLLVTNIERTYDADGNLLETLVYTQNPDDDVREMYATKYEYEFFDE